MQELNTLPMKEIISSFLTRFNTAWFEEFIKKQCLPNVPKLLKALPGDVKNLLEKRLRDDYLKYGDQFTYPKFILVLHEYRPDLYALTMDPVGERWFKAFWIMIERYFQSLK
jgi:hypothetical protein